MSQKTYTVAVAGLGKRGIHHADAFSQNPRFKLVGVCDIDTARLGAAKQKYGVAVAETDAGQMLARSKPEEFERLFLPSSKIRTA